MALNFDIKRVLIDFQTNKGITNKLKIAGLVAMLTATIASNGQDADSDNPPTSTEINIITIKAIGNEKIDYERLSEIRGTVRNRETSDFSFCLVDFQGTKVYSSNISAADGKFDENDEEFIILMPDKLPEAQYKMVIYADSKNNQRKEKEKTRFTISL